MKLIHIHGVWPLYTNTFLLISAAGHAVVVDPAAEAETYLAQLKENNATLTDIFLTHGHYDHIGGLTENGRAVFPNAYVYINENLLFFSILITPKIFENLQANSLLL